MIDTSSWKEFRVGDFFHGVRGTSRKMQELNEGKTPVIAAARYNQGIAGYYDVPSEYENAITISCNGVGCGSTYYHDYPFAITGDAIVLENIGNVPIGALHFIASVYDVYFSRKYSYTDKCSADKAEAEFILLPATSDGQPDWDYMESYMKAVMEESEKSLENLRKADDAKHLIDVSGWKRFHLYDDCMFGIDMGTKMDKAKMKELHPSVNFVGRANANNGITTCVDKIDDIEPYPSGYMTLSLGGEYLGSCFIQPKSFYTSQNVIVLIPNDNMTDNIKRFIASMIFKESRSKYKAFVDELNRHIKTDFSIPLPITSTGEPDWQYMEDYMRKIMDKSEQIISDLQIGA